MLLTARYACFMGKNQTPEHRFWYTRSSIEHHGGWKYREASGQLHIPRQHSVLQRRQSSWYNVSHCSCVVSHVFSATSLEGSIPLVTDEDPGKLIQNPSFTRSSLRLRDMDCTRCRWTTFGGFPQDLLARSHQELRGRSAYRSISGIGSHHTPPELRLRSHCQAFWRHASPPSTPVSCRSDSRPSPWPKLEASPRPSQQPADWPSTQGQQHATSWRRSTTRGHSGVTLQFSTSTRWRRWRRHYNVHFLSFSLYFSVIISTTL